MRGGTLCAIATFALATLRIGASPAVTIDTDKAALILGGLVRGGLSFQLFSHLSLFGDYRYSFFPDFEVRDKSGLHFTTDLNTHNVVGGLSIRF